MKPDGMSL